MGVNSSQSRAKKPQPANAGAVDLATKFIQDWIDIWFPRSGLPGLTIAIRNKDGLIMNRSWGYANLKTKEELTPKHIFRVASQSKMFTATGIALLKERGLLAFDDAASQYLPWLKTKPGMESVTIRQLLGHVSGVIRDGDDSRFWNLDRAFPDAASLRKHTGHIGTAGENIKSIKYSNIGYALLGQIIEAVSGKSYDRFMTEEIIKPLGLKNTTPDYNPAKRHKMAAGYDEPFYLKRDRVAHDVPTGTIAAAAGFCGTPSDLSRFTLSQVRPGRDVIGACSKQELCRRFNAVALDPGTTYGLGRERTKIGRHIVIGHGGNFPGQKTGSAGSAELDMAVSVAINSADGAPEAIAKNIFRTLFYFIEHGLTPGTGKNAGLGGLYNTGWAAFEGKPEKLAVFELWDMDPTESKDNPFKDILSCPRTGPGTFRISGDSGWGNEGESIEFLKKHGKQAMKYAGWAANTKSGPGVS